MIFDESDDPNSGVPRRSLTTREMHIKLHSLVWNQLSAEAYSDMIRYSWHNTDPNWSAQELAHRPKPLTAPDISFGFNETAKCEFRDASNTMCPRSAFIKCAHCGRLLCLQHFLDRKCFHSTDEPRAGPSHEHNDLVSQHLESQESYLFNDIAHDDVEGELPFDMIEEEVENIENNANDELK